MAAQCVGASERGRPGQLSSPAHWTALHVCRQTMLPVLALSCCAMALVSKRVPNMPLLGVSGKVGITITPPLAVYGAPTSVGDRALPYGPA